MPDVCFLAGRIARGLTGAIALTVAWNACCQTLRWLGAKPFSGVLAISLIGLVTRASMALSLGLAWMYFVVPAMVTAASGVVYLASAFTATSLLTRIVKLFVPASVVAVDDQRFAGLFRKATVLYGTEQLLVATASLVMVERLPVTVYVASIL